MLRVSRKEEDMATFRSTMEILRDTGRGKAAVFVAAFLSYLSEHGESPLREAQATSADWVEAQGGEISLAYVKILSRELKNYGLTSYRKVGRHYYVDLTDKGANWFDTLPEGWGTKLELSSAAERAEAREEIKVKPFRRIKGGTSIDSVVWRAYLAAQKRAKLDILFVPAGSEVKVISRGKTGRFSAYEPEGQRAE